VNEGAGRGISASPNCVRGKNRSVSCPLSLPSKGNSVWLGVHITEVIDLEHQAMFHRSEWHNASFLERIGGEFSQMVVPVTRQIASRPNAIGLSYWMGQVLEECDRASQHFAADSVHDLRVALRRCRSVADGLITIDPRPGWKEMKKVGKSLFQSLGDLRDVQVMEEWLARLFDVTDPARISMEQYLADQQSQLKKDAAEALEKFDRKHWEKSRRTLPGRASRVRQGSIVFQHLALECWTDAYALHQAALRNRSRVAMHNLRIGIKKFRYIVENFLPTQHAEWRRDLKELQDILGEVHDLDVLWEVAQRGKFVDVPDVRQRWHAKLLAERTTRIAKYRAKMVGPGSLWKIWRAALPSDAQIGIASLQRLRLSASFLDSNLKHSRHVARLSLQLYDTLPASKQNLDLTGRDSRAILEVSSLFSNAGNGGSETKGAKQSARLVRKLAVSLGWSQDDLNRVSLIVRYQGGNLLRPAAKAATNLTSAQWAEVLRLAGIVRLAKSFDANQNGRISRVAANLTREILEIRAQGYSSRGPLAPQIAAARYLLETAYRRPIVVKALRPPKRIARKKS
jgi:CHAD domain-containing protein